MADRHRPAAIAEGWPVDAVSTITHGRGQRTVVAAVSHQLSPFRPGVVERRIERVGAAQELEDLIDRLLLAETGRPPADLRPDKAQRPTEE
jgi:hypothetical protein